jgi:general secretion pathway protein K
MTRRRRQRGVILISVLILVALAAVVAAGLFFDTGLSARRAAGSFGMEEALQLGQGAEALAAYALSQDTNQTDTPQDAWAQPSEQYQVAPEVVLQGRLVDLQGRFNINMLVGANGVRDENAHKVFVRLLALLQLDTGIADLIVDWIDPDGQAEPQGGEDSLYMSQDPPHLAADLAVTSISELMQIPGMTRDIFLKLKPHIAALPPSVRQINVCMADGFVLDALYALNENEQSHVEYSLLSAEQLAQQRSGDCFPRRAALAAGAPTMQAMTSERTNWFQLQTWVRIGTAEFDLYSLIYRQGRQARAVMRSLGTD